MIEIHGYLFGSILLLFGSIAFLFDSAQVSSKIRMTGSLFFFIGAMLLTLDALIVEKYMTVSGLWF